MKQNHSVTVKFLDGPREGEEITVPNPPPAKLKLGMPQWTVYEWSEEGYSVVMTGDLAKLWRNPEPSEFHWGV